MKRSNICPLCINNQNETKTFVKKNINCQNIGEFSYSSRKVPEFMNYELLKCDVCTFIYAINIPDLERLKNNYENSTYPFFRMLVNIFKEYYACFYIV